MQSRDPTTTRIFLATLLEPLVTRLSEKYDVVVHNTVRDSSMRQDWSAFAGTPQSARDALIDTWCLANCDEVWCGTSNMIVFAGCINPDLKIHLLPTLAASPGL